MAAAPFVTCPITRPTFFAFGIDARSGPPLPPRPSAPWQVEQLSAKIALPAAAFAAAPEPVCACGLTSPGCVTHTRPCGRGDGAELSVEREQPEVVAVGSAGERVPACVEGDPRLLVGFAADRRHRDRTGATTGAISVA